MMSKQIQEGGDSSNNYQAKEMTVNILGIDEKRAREICKEMHAQLRNEYSEEAVKVAQSRVKEFEDRLMPKMESVEGALEAFANPSFQLLLVEAQKTAAATERPADYDLLSELLVHRFQKGENRVARAGISRAVKIVDEIDDGALLGLTMLHTINSFFPVTGDIFQGLDDLNELYGKILYGSLPLGRDWLDHLDILDAVRLSSVSTLKKIEDYYPERLYGYVDVGIRKNSENFDKAMSIIETSGLPKEIVIEHVLNSEFVRVPVSDRRQIESLTLVKQFFNQGVFIPKSVDLSDSQKKAVNMIYDLYSHDVNVKSENIRLFMENWDGRANLNIIKKWWNSINIGAEVTSVGRVLAHSNAQRCDSNLPPMD